MDKIPKDLKYFVYQVPGENFSCGVFRAESAEDAKEIPELKAYPENTPAVVYEVNKETYLQVLNKLKTLGGK